MMNFRTPKFWQKKYSFFTLILIPFSIIWIIISLIRRLTSSEKNYSIPIICVGNIYVGGTGKTPLSIKIANELKNKKPVIIRKFHHNHEDEYELIKNKTKFLIINSSRGDGINQAIRKKYKFVILDDGFQDHSIKKNLSILCFKSEQLFGNGYQLPAGPLRENLNALKRAKIIVINGGKNKFFEKQIKNISKNIKIFYTNYYPKNFNKFKRKSILAFAGIGAPENFFQILKTNKLNVKKTLSFPDHYNYTRTDIEKIVKIASRKKLQILTTEKDYFRIKKFNIKKINYLKVGLKILNKEKFFKEILKYL